jgi:signal transduction histidine kinase
VIGAREWGRDSYAWYMSTATAAGAWRRPPPTRRQRRADVAIALALAAGTVASALLARAAGVELGRTPPEALEEALWCLAVSLPLAFRRAWPLPVLVVVAAAFVGLQARYVAETQLSSVCLFLALFTAGAWAADRTLARAVRLVVVVVMFAWLAYVLSATAWAEQFAGKGQGQLLPPATASMIWVTAVNVLYFGAAWFFGDLAWSQARQQALLEQRTVELAHERDRNARRAVLAERVRIARELHDVVAHHVSVMGVQAGAARVVLDSDPGATRAALSAIESGARSALEEMHRLLGVLRDPATAGPADAAPDAHPDADADVDAEHGHDADLAPLPGLDAVDALLDRARAAGLEVGYAVVGDPAPVPAGVALSAYRVVQEAVTNTLRHAAATRLDVRVRYLGAGLEVEVVDDGRGTTAPLRSSGRRGLGLAGMRERVALHGGDLEVGPRPGGGYRVRARFPLSSSVSEPAAR